MTVQILTFVFNPFTVSFKWITLHLLCHFSTLYSTGDVDFRYCDYSLRNIWGNKITWSATGERRKYKLPKMENISNKYQNDWFCNAAIFNEKIVINRNSGLSNNGNLSQTFSCGLLLKYCSNPDTINSTTCFSISIATFFITKKWIL